MKNEMNKNRPQHDYLNVLRVLACLLVVGVHASASDWDNIAVNTVKWQVMNFYDCLSLIGVPLFFMISGALMLDKNYKIDLKKMYLNKILHLVVVYHIWLFIYNTIPFLQGNLIFDFVTVKDELFLRTLFGKGAYHLWFLPELILMYILTPILQRAFEDKNICRYFLIIFMITGTFLPVILQYDFPYRRIVNGYYERTSLTMLTGYIGYYVLGHYIHSFTTGNIDKFRSAIMCGISILCVSVIALACGIDSIEKNMPSSIINTPLNILAFIASTCIFEVIRGRCKNVDSGYGRWIKKIAGLTFGIYLIHPIFLMILQSIGFSTLYPHTIIMVPILTIVLFLLSAFTTFLLQKIPIIKKLV